MQLTLGELREKINQHIELFGDAQNVVLNGFTTFKNGETAVDFYTDEFIEITPQNGGEVNITFDIDNSTLKDEFDRMCEEINKSYQSLTELSDDIESLEHELDCKYNKIKEIKANLRMAQDLNGIDVKIALNNIIDDIGEYYD